MENKVAGFWIRLISRAIDFSLFLALSLGIAFANIKKTNGVTNFDSTGGFYIWILLSIFILIVIFILFPIFTCGKTPSMYLLRIKIEFKNEKISTSILKREVMYSIIWIANLFLILTLINHTLIEKFLHYKKGDDLSILNNLRIGLFAGLSSITILIQWIFSISIIIKKNKMGIHDKYSNTKTIWENKFVKKVADNTLGDTVSIKPFAIENKPIKWLEVK